MAVLRSPPRAGHAGQPTYLRIGPVGSRASPFRRARPLPWLRAGSCNPPAGPSIPRPVVGQFLGRVGPSARLVDSPALPAVVAGPEPIYAVREHYCPRPIATGQIGQKFAPSCGDARGTSIRNDRAPILGALLLRFARDLLPTRRGDVPARHTFGIATLG